LTTATPIERVVGILTEANYRPVSRPFTVASVPFEFAAVLVGTGKAPDLIVVADTVEDTELRIRQKIDSLGRALDVAGSRRPLTAVLVGPKPSDLTLDLVGRVCRVLPVGTPTGGDAESQLRDWLAVLLPLPLPDPNQAVADPQGELGQRLPKDLDEHLRTELLKASSQGAKGVQQALGQLLVEPLAEIESLAGDEP
jgi:hypothetical protein